MFVFVADACAIARIYANDIGTKNMRQIYHYPNSRLLTPFFAPVEALSALLSMLNGGFIDEPTYQAARGAMLADFAQRRISTFHITVADLKVAQQFLEKHKRLPGRGGLGGADALYFALAMRLNKQLKDRGDRVILITSDGPLYRAVLDEQDVEVFHFWTCGLGCGHTDFIPIKGAPRPPKPPNQCPVCLTTCPVCRVDVCPSNYVVAF